MDKFKIPNNCGYKFSLSKKNSRCNNKQKGNIEIIDEEW